MNTPTINPRNATHFIEAYVLSSGKLIYDKMYTIDCLANSLFATKHCNLTTHHIFLITKK